MNLNQEKKNKLKKTEAEKCKITKFINNTCFEFEKVLRSVDEMEINDYILLQITKFVHLIDTLKYKLIQDSE